MTKPLNREKIQSGLSNRIIGRKLGLFQEIDSTNQRAVELAKKGEKEGAVIIAETQSKGRGRMGRPWLSPPGGMYLSLILRPKISPEDSSLIVFLTAVAVAESLKAQSLSPTIKWPNDILIDSKKICGILTEMKIKEDKIDYLVVGIGININTDLSLLPQEIREKSTSLKEILKKDIDRNGFIKTLLISLEKWYLEFINKGKEKIFKEWRSYANIMGRRVRIDEPNRSIEGRVVKIKENGALVLKANEKTEEITGGDLTFLDRL